MHNAWVFSCEGNTCAPAVTILQKVYTIFGSSTWQNSGIVEDCSCESGAQIIPWEEALNVLTREWLCDANTMRIFYSSERIDNIDMENTVDPMAFGVKNSYNYGRQNGEIVYLDKTQFEKDKSNSSLLTNFPQQWTLTLSKNTPKEDPMTSSLPEKTIGFMGHDLKGNEAFLIRCFKRQFIINCQHCIDPYMVNRAFTMFDAGEFCHVAPDEMTISCIHCASALATIPRICGFPGIINATSSMELSVGENGEPCFPCYAHSYNTYQTKGKQMAIDATCLMQNDPSKRWLHDNFTDEDFLENRTPRKIEKREKELSSTFSFMIKKGIYLYSISDINTEKKHSD